MCSCKMLKLLMTNEKLETEQPVPHACLMLDLLSSLSTSEFLKKLVVGPRAIPRDVKPISKSKFLLLV